jgi:uncharacterized membrane protein (DUF4010 family)
MGGAGCSGFANNMNTFEWTFELRFVVALALGFLVGLERETAGVERKIHVLAGVRTYTLISLYGFGCGWLSRINVGLALPVGMLSIVALVLVEYLSKVKEGRTGWTSEVAALLTFIVGALTLLTDIWVPMALGIISTILLSEKAEIEKHVERLDKSEFLAVLKFLLVTVIILPVLPDQEYTPFKLNPTRIWQIVIMVSTIGFVGYFLTKKFGSKVGLWLSGVLGGIVSSTAVSVAAGRMAQNAPERSGSALQASLLASSVMYFRILVFIWIINPAFLPFLWWKLLALAAIGIAMAFLIKASRADAEAISVPSLQNPFEVRPAVLFAVLFVILSVVTILVKNAFGNVGVLLLSGFVGVTDITPFVLSLIHIGAAPVEAVMISAIIVAMMSNTLVKGVYFGMLAKPVRQETFWKYGLWSLLHVTFILLQ